ncbi:ROK family transcriptional regulator [bacterium]|nr:ROK family transcriptional regulator [bacterium]
MRKMNQSLVLNMIRLNGPISRAQIARESGLSAPTISSLVDTLIRDELVFEREEGESSGGRRPVLLSLNPAGGFVIGISVREDRLAGALVNLTAKVIDFREASFDAENTQDVLTAISEMVGQLLEATPSATSKLFGVGVGLSEGLSRRTGRTDALAVVRSDGESLRTLLKDALAISAPILVDREANCLALAEKWFGIARDLDHFIAIQMGSQIGMGVMVNGRLYNGRGGAGAVAHMVVDPDGALCGCGNRGCLTTLVADPHLVDQARAIPALATRVESIQDLRRMAADGEASATLILRQAGVHLGRALVNLRSLFDPALILLAGEDVRHWGVFREAIIEAVDNDPLHLGDPMRILRIRELETPDRAWATAGLALQKIFEAPIYQQQV